MMKLILLPVLLHVYTVSAAVRIAFFGDQGVSHGAKSVLHMVKDFQADYVVHLGDFDYYDMPRLFRLQYTSILSEDYPYFAVMGNHDLRRVEGYQDVLRESLSNSLASDFCEGDIGLNYYCIYKGVLIVYSTVGVLGSNHVEYISSVFERFRHVRFKVCAWHKNQAAYQTGHKRDETGYGVYDLCRQYGAIIATGHEHSYARTKIMSSFEEKTVASHDTESVTVKPGETFAIVSGLGGRSIRPWEKGHERDEWWASLASASNGVNYGALFCDFFANNSVDQVYCAFIDISGQVWDSFDVKVERGN